MKEGISLARSVHDTRPSIAESRATVWTHNRRAWMGDSRRGFWKMVALNTLGHPIPRLRRSEAGE